jgi:hypothetical protein
MRPSDLLWRIHRLERARGAGSTERAGLRRVERRLKREKLYEREREALRAQMPDGWRIVEDMLVGQTGHICAARLRPTCADLARGAREPPGAHGRAGLNFALLSPASTAPLGTDDNRELS